MNALRAPLLHFLLLGGLLHLAAQFLPPRAAPIVLSAAQVQAWRAQWARETGAVPTPDQERAGLRRVADEEALVREALRLGLDRADPVVRGRLVQNLRFADPGSPRSDARLLEDARALGMPGRDAVTRRRLVQVMERRLAPPVAVREPQIDAYLRVHPERYAAPARFAFRHVFFSGDRPDALERALQAPASGDPFLLGERLPPQTRAQLARQFGEDFAAGVAALAPGQWSAPLRSAYGIHLVRTEAVPAAGTGSPAEVRRQARYALLEELERENLRAALADLRRRYPLQVALR